MLAVYQTPMNEGTPIEQSRSICGAKTKSGLPCQKAPMANGKCRLHGGLTPTGFDLPQTKHGRYSKYLPSHLVGSYEISRADTDLLEMKDNVALIDVRLQELLTRLADGESLTSWGELGNLLLPLAKAVEERNGTRATALMKQVLEAWQAVYDDSVIWKEIIDVTETRRKLVESERKRLIDMDLVITADRAYMLVAFLQDIIMRHIADDGVKASIAYEIRRVLADGASKQSGPDRGEG